jgi:predicted amidohydrolase YtcJ
VAIKAGRILKVGTNGEVAKFIGKNTKIIDLGGKTVLPGLIDTHIHVGDFGRMLMWMDLSGTNSIKELQQLLKERLRQVGKGRWVIGRGWDEKSFTEKRLPTRFDLDDVSPCNPVIFYYKCGSVAVVNSEALELSGITKETAASADSAIDKDAATGELTGILRGSATDFVWRMIPEPTDAELAESAELAFNKILAAGITSIHWLATSETDLSVLRSLCKAKKLPLRVYMVLQTNHLHRFADEKTRAEIEDEHLRVGGVEIYADGFLSSKTAALAEPYSDNGSLAPLAYAQKEINAQAAAIRRAGLQVIIHAMGDKAIDAALTAIEHLGKDGGRPRIDEAAVLSGEIVQRIKRLEPVLSVQPCVMASEFIVYSATERLGKGRVRWLYPLKTLFKEGVRVCGGSDCPMEPLNPLQGIQAAITGHVLGEERICLDEALCMYTMNAAYASCEENLKGSIEEGKLADFTVLSNDPHAVASSEIQKIIVEMTVVGGKVVFSA